VGEEVVMPASSKLTATSLEPTKGKQSEKAAQMLLSVFKYYDKNKDGSLSIKELKQGIAQTGLTLDYMKAADTDGDQKVSKQEFVDFFDPIPDKEVDEIREWLLEKQSPAAKAMLLEVFAKYDKSGDGVLSVAEITKGIEGTGLALEYMLEGDRDGDQRVNKEEWLQFFDPIPDAEVEEVRAWLEAKA
jgi:Ca2+-binding EF-hand superfamily protein